jgi:uncharacterized OB-fold protein
MDSGISPAKAAVYPRPGFSRDFAFFYEGIKNSRLLVAKCGRCGRLHHPPGPMCPMCHGNQWLVHESNGRGIVYSFTIHYHPPIPPFSIPHAMALVDMEEGFRFFADIRGVAPSDLHVGLPVEIAFVNFEADFRMPVFQPRRSL